MSFGNFRSHSLESGHGQAQAASQGYAFGRSFQRRSPPASNTQSVQQAQPTSVSSEGYSGNSKTDLTVLTAEGDRVTISLAAQVKYAASSQTGSGGSSQTVAAASSSSQLSVTVEGNLNETELKDLGTLLRSLAPATSQASSQAGSQTQSIAASNASPAIPDASASNTGFASLGSLAAFAYSYQQTVEAGTLVSSTG